MRNAPVKCTRCRNNHMESERLPLPHKSIKGADEMVCPRCGCRSYYDMTPQVAWCFASGGIEFGDEGSAPEGCIVIARGPKCGLKALVSTLARHGHEAGVLLVPGVPEAEDQRAAAEALATWLNWCAGKKNRNGVVFNKDWS